MRNKDKQIISRILNKAVEDILPSKEYLKTLLNSNKKLRIYQGFDPTAPTLHIGHTVMMRKLEDFRKLGHEVIFLIGNFTAMIGDPSDKKATRTQLTKEQVEENLKLYKEQASAIIDINNRDNPVKIMYNYDWLGSLTFDEVIKLSSEFTVQQMIKRSMFQERLTNDKPIGLHEFLYPLMQGYDSVAMDVDVELGGNDQLFNMLAGRTLMKSLKNKEKIVIAGKLLTTSDGKKMGKSEGNMIMLSDSPENIYGKVMAYPDGHIMLGFELLTNYDLDQIEELKNELSLNPMYLKKLLAYTIVKEIKGDDEAIKAQTHFESIYQKKTYNTNLDELTHKNMNLLEYLIETKTIKSKSEGRRLIEQGAVKINDKRIENTNTKVIKGILKIGKRVYNIV